MMATEDAEVKAREAQLKAQLESIKKMEGHLVNAQEFNAQTAFIGNGHATVSPLNDPEKPNSYTIALDANRSARIQLAPDAVEAMRSNKGRFWETKPANNTQTAGFNIPDATPDAVTGFARRDGVKPEPQPEPEAPNPFARHTFRRPAVEPAPEPATETSAPAKPISFSNDPLAGRNPLLQRISNPLPPGLTLPTQEQSAYDLAMEAAGNQHDGGHALTKAELKAIAAASPGQKLSTAPEATTDPMVFVFTVQDKFGRAHEVPLRVSEEFVVQKPEPQVGSSLPHIDFNKVREEQLGRAHYALEHPSEFTPKDLEVYRGIIEREEASQATKEPITYTNPLLGRNNSFFVATELETGPAADAEPAYKNTVLTPINEFKTRGTALSTSEVTGMYNTTPASETLVIMATDKPGVFGFGNGEKGQDGKPILTELTVTPEAAQFLQENASRYLTQPAPSAIFAPESPDKLMSAMVQYQIDNPTYRMDQYNEISVRALQDNPTIQTSPSNDVPGMWHFKSGDYTANIFVTDELQAKLETKQKINTPPEPTLDAVAPAPTADAPSKPVPTGDNLTIAANAKDSNLILANLGNKDVQAKLASLSGDNKFGTDDVYALQGALSEKNAAIVKEVAAMLRNHDVRVADANVAPNSATATSVPAPDKGQGAALGG